MEPFHFNTEANTYLSERYPPSEEFSHAWKRLTTDGQAGMLRAFITEGIPFAFCHVPILYEAVRDFIALRLDLKPTQVTLIGSARIGYSLAPPPEYGKPFSSQSDLDFSLVSETLFKGLAESFNVWKEDVKTGRATVRNAREEKFWRENLQVVPQNVARGFIDAYKVPNRYPLPMKVSQTFWLLHHKLTLTRLAPETRQVSVRVYRDWDAFFRQVCLNLSVTMRKLSL